MKIKKVLAGFLAGILLFLTPGGAVYAEESAGTQQQESEEAVSAEEQEKQEKAASYAEKIETNAISNWPQGNLCSVRDRYGHEQRGSTVCQESRRTKISGKYYKDFECTDGIAVCKDDGHGCLFGRQYLFFAVG